GDESRRVDGRDGRTAARPRDRAPSERVAARVPRGRGELHGLVHLDRRRGRRDVDRGDRWGRRWRRRRWWWRRWRRWWWRRRRRRRDVERTARPPAERSGGRRQRVARAGLVDLDSGEGRHSAHGTYRSPTPPGPATRIRPDRQRD